VAEAAPSVSAAPPTVVVPPAEAVLPETPPSPTNSVSEKATAKKGGRSKKAVAETSAPVPPLSLSAAEPTQPPAGPGPAPAPYTAPATVPIPAVAPAATAEPAKALLEKAVEAVEDSKAPIHVRRKKIPKAIRTLTWNLHIGAHRGEDRCMCCKEKKIDIANFHCELPLRTRDCGGQGW